MPSLSQSSAAASISAPKVLVVDDEKLIRDIVADFLALEGYTVRTASDGLSASAELQRARYDVVITDLKMPNMGGLDLLAEIRRSNPEALTVVMTGFGTVESAIEAMKEGAYDYVLKPFKVEQLVELVKRGLAARAEPGLSGAGLPSLRPEQEGDAALRVRLGRVFDTLYMAYHPIISARDGSTFGYEALLRSVESSLADPPSVIWAAERLNVVEELGRKVRAAAVGAFQGAPPGTALFVNLHPSDLLDTALFSPASPLSAIAPRVVLEITERASLETLHDLSRRLAELRELGFRIAIDDLGAGYAGLGAFADLEPDIVKLDMSLVRGVHRHPTRQKIVRSVIALAKDTGVLVVAEGVETHEECEILKELGCDLLQGFLFARPDRKIA